MNDNSNSHAGESAQTSDINKFREYWQVVLERRWLIIATFTVVVVLGIFYAFKATPIYEAVARLQIDPETGGALSLREVMSFGSKDTDYLQTQYRNLQSRSLIDAVMVKLNLGKDPRYEPRPDPLKAVSEDIEIAPIRLTRLVEVKTRHPDPKVAMAMANTLVDIFLLQNQDRKFKKASDGLRMLQTEANIQAAQLTTAIELLQKYRVEKGMISLTDDYKQGENVDSQALRNARADVDQQASRTAGIQKLADEGEKWIKEGKDVADFYGVNQDKLVSELKGKITVAESQLTQLRARYRDKHPQIIGLLNSLQTDRERLKVESQRAFDAILSNLQVEKAAETQARVRLKAAEDRISAVNEARTKYDVLNRQKEKEEFMYQQILAKLKEYDLNAKDKQQNMVIIDPAIKPLKWVKPNRPLVIAASIVGGLVGSSRVDLQACKLEYSIVSPK